MEGLLIGLRTKLETKNHFTSFQGTFLLPGQWVKPRFLNQWWLPGIGRFLTSKEKEGSIGSFGNFPG